MTESERQAWERERAQGRDKFILRGLLHNGLPFATVFVTVYFLSDLFRHTIDSPAFEVRILVATFLILVLGGGWGAGAQVWYKREREYHESLSQK